MSDLKVICRICREVVALIDPFEASYPLNGAMFKSPDAEHGHLPPFESWQEWVDFRCPYGKMHRPFTLDNEILTEQGILVIDKATSQFHFRHDEEIGRESIIDREPPLPMLSEEEAAALVRAEMNPKQEKRHDETQVRTGQEKGSESVKGPQKEQNEQGEGSRFVCIHCRKDCKNGAGLSAHIRNKHGEVNHGPEAEN